MAIVVRDNAPRAARLADRSRTRLVVSVGPNDAPENAPVVRVGVTIGDTVLAAKVSRAITRELQSAIKELEGTEQVVRGHRVSRQERALVRVPSRAVWRRLEASVAGAIAIVPVSERRLKSVAGLVRALREAGAAGVQLVWDGQTPPREVAERTVFRILEHARATPGEAPVVLAPTEEPVEALLILIAART